MGAAASVNAVFDEATTWFKNYFDEQTYIEDFQSIDKNNDGSVTYAELKVWIAGKAKKEGGNWKTLLDTPEVYKIAHIQTSNRYSQNSNDVVRTQIFGITEFRTFLIFLFLISILSVHFRSADSWDDGGDARNDTLSLDEFRLANRSFCNTRKQEQLTDEQLKEDFDALDANGDGMVPFVELCNYFCANFEADMNNKEGKSTKGAGLIAHFSDDSGTHVKEVVGAAAKTTEALAGIQNELDKSRKIANLTEIKLSTELAIGHSSLINPDAQMKLMENIEKDLSNEPFNPDEGQSSSVQDTGSKEMSAQPGAPADSRGSASTEVEGNLSGTDKEKLGEAAIEASNPSESLEQPGSTRAVPAPLALDTGAA